MGENLKATHYQNGDLIPHVIPTLDWHDLETGGRCYYDDDSLGNASTYGALYNWYAVVDERMICPEDWHVPSDHEWNVLALYLDPTVDTLDNGSFSGTEIGGQLKEAGTAHWDDPNTGATNASGFTALPGGHRYGSGQYHDLHTDGVWWSSSPGYTDSHAWYRRLFHVTAGMQRITYFKEDGMSCRCVRDLPTTAPEDPIDDGGIRIYPNPTTDRLFIAGAAASGIVRVFDAFGRCVAQQALSNGTTIDVQAWAPGVYVVHLTGTGLNVRRSVMKD